MHVRNGKKEYAFENFSVWKRTAICNISYKPLWSPFLLEKNLLHYSGGDAWRAIYLRGKMFL